MTIRKDIPFCSIEIGKNSLWVNSINGCILRIANLNFTQDFDKFTRVDIQGNNAYVIEEVESDGGQVTELTRFLNILNQNLIYDLTENPQLCNDDLLQEISNLVEEKKYEK